jgi:hypothetical protein
MSFPRCCFDDSYNVHRHAVNFEILKIMDVVPHDEIVFAPGVAALRDMDVRIAVECLSGIEVVVIPRNDVEIPGLESFGGTLALPFQITQSRSSCFSKKNLLHYLPQRNVAR